MHISKSLAGKTIAITGSTGFLGTCLVEKLLRSVPECNLLLLIRPSTRGSQRRMETEILNNNAFNRLKEELGKEKFKEMAAKRITPIAADITKQYLGISPEDMELLTKAEIFIHSAAAVSFSSQLDDAIQTNLLGPVQIVETLKSIKAENEQYKIPHLIAISTAYVAGNKRGLVAEKLLEDLNTNITDIDIEAEIEASKRAQANIEDESRNKVTLEKFDKAAKRDLGAAAGISALSRKREQLRKTWVKENLIEMGRSRASSFGFADIYGMTKAMAEKAICENAKGEIPLSIIRPSIIESALHEPFPGWIRGFRMAEPIIISYARGLLKDFPAKPDGILDVIPVDLVVAAICAVAAGDIPELEEKPKVMNVASGSTNPFLFRDFHNWCHNWFTENPIYDEQNRPISPHRWSYPNRIKVQKQLRQAKRFLTLGDSIARKLPIRGKQALAVAGMEENLNKLRRVEGYLELYGKYVECDAIFGTTNLLELFDSLEESDKKDFSFDPQTFDWHDYLTRIHLPSVMIQGRIKTKPSSKDTLRGSARLRKAVLSPERELAVFDLENTLIASNVVSSWGWLASRHLSGAERFKFIASTLMEAPRLISMDRVSREDFLQHFYKRYKGASSHQLSTDSQEMFSELLLKKSFPAAIYRIRKHKELGHRTLLLTGALNFVVEPLKPLFDDIICTELNQKNGRYTGTLKGINPIGDLRAEVLKNYATEHGIDISNTVAYADSVSDIALLEAVGFPVAVNPEIKLASIARRRGWLVENFSKATGYDSKLLPIAPFQDIVKAS